MAVENNTIQKLETSQETTYREKMYYAAGVALMAAVATAIAGATIPAVGITAISAGIAYKGYSTFDINNPADLKILQDEAKSLPLQDVIEKHGWETLKTYDILSSRQIEEKFKGETRHQTGTEVLQMFSYQDFDRFAEIGMFTPLQIETIQQIKGELYRFNNFIERQLAHLEHTYNTELRQIEIARSSLEAKPAEYYDNRRDRLMCKVERQLIALEKERMEYEHSVNKTYIALKRGN